MNKRVKILLKTAAAVLLAAVLLVLAYAAYVFIAYHRIEDKCQVAVTGKTNSSPETGTVYNILCWNIGFGAYEDDYGFFMDGGTQSRAWSRERLEKNIDSIAALLADRGAEFCLVQELDIDSTRSFHMDQRVPIQAALDGYCSTFAQNYDSPYLMYPLTQPHGASKSGIMTFSRFDISDCLRRSLPVETGLMKIVDLDRCYSVNRVPTCDGAELVLYNFHLSAYTSDGTIAVRQLEMLIRDMQGEYEKGNYCVAAGDFNKDILGNSREVFGGTDTEANWGQPLPEGIFDGTNVVLVAPVDPNDPVPSCRNADGPYHRGQYVLTVDGFLVTDNVTVYESEVVDTQFAYSDHNPVRMSFSLGPRAK